MVLTESTAIGSFMIPLRIRMTSSTLHVSVDIILGYSVLKLVNYEIVKCSTKGSSIKTIYVELPFTHKPSLMRRCGFYFQEKIYSFCTLHGGIIAQFTIAYISIFQFISRAVNVCEKLVLQICYLQL